MEIFFKNDELRRICGEPRYATKKFGSKSARKLRSRLADIMAAAHVLELCAGHPHPLKRDRAGLYAVSLHGGHRVVFEPANEPVPAHADGGIAWNQVTKVRIVEIGDYHD